MKEKLKNTFSNFFWFFNYLRFKIIIGLILSIMVGFLDGLGLTMFLPLLQMVSGSKSSNSEGMGNLSFVIESISYFNLELTLLSVLILMVFFFTLKGIFKYLNSIYRVILQQEMIRKIRIKENKQLKY